MPTNIEHGIAHPKPQRIVNEALLEIVQALPCMACGQTPSDPHHITTRGAGGGDTPQNLIPLCREHHQLWHSQGATYMLNTYPCVKFWLEGAGRTDILGENAPQPPLEAK